MFLGLHDDLDSKLFEALEEVAFQLVHLDPVQIVHAEFRHRGGGF